MILPMEIGIGLSLARNAGGGLDADAAAYIAAVETALSSSITATQKNAINTFFKTGKSDGWYSSIKRLYLPIWADAAANAIDMVTRTSGTFTASGVDHSNVGYIQGDGSTGYFDIGSTAPSLGITDSTGLLFALQTDYTSGAEKGVIGSTASSFNGSTLLQSNALLNQIRLVNVNSTAILNLDLNDTNGILIGSCIANNDRFTLFRSASRLDINTDTTLKTGSISALNPYVMARNVNGSPSAFNNARFGAYGTGLGLSQSSATSFTLALKNLWENASGLTLP